MNTEENAIDQVYKQKKTKQLNAKIVTTHIKRCWK